MPRLPRAITTALAATTIALAACGSDDPGGDPTAAPTAVPTAVPTDDTSPTKVIGVAAGTFDAPIVLLPRPGDDALWLAERGGTVRRVAVADDGALTPIGEPVLDIRSLTTPEGERGLLGMAFDEDGDTLFVSHTDVDGNSDVAAYAVDDDAVDADSRDVLFEIDQPYDNHNGGHIVLGPDGRLWFGLGDGGSQNDPDNRAQDDDTFLGKLVAIDLDSGEATAVAKGLRNPWRFAFDTDGSLWIGDVGQGTAEEVNHVAADAIEGANFGWSGYEGTQLYQDEPGRVPAEHVPPVFEYGRDGGNCSITGGLPYRGEELTELQGMYLFADFCAGRIRALQIDDDGTPTAVDLDVPLVNPISFGTDADGEVYVLGLMGDVIRLAAS